MTLCMGTGIMKAVEATEVKQTLLRQFKIVGIIRLPCSYVQVEAAKDDEERSRNSSLSELERYIMEVKEAGRDKDTSMSHIPVSYE